MNLLIGAAYRQIIAALADMYHGAWVYGPGAVFADLAAAVADGAIASTVSDSCAAIGSTCLARKARRPRCGG